MSTPEIGKIYTVERHGQPVLAVVRDVTQFQAKVEIDDEDGPIWIQLSAIGDEVTTSEITEEQPLLALLVNAQALIERAIVQIMTQEEDNA